MQGSGVCLLHAEASFGLLLEARTVSCEEPYLIAPISLGGLAGRIARALQYRSRFSHLLAQQLNTIGASSNTPLLHFHLDFTEIAEDHYYRALTIVLLPSNALAAVVWPMSGTHLDPTILTLATTRISYGQSTRWAFT